MWRCFFLESLVPLRPSLCINQHHIACAGHALLPSSNDLLLSFHAQLHKKKSSAELVKASVSNSKRRKNKNNVKVPSTHKKTYKTEKEEKGMASHLCPSCSRRGHAIGDCPVQPTGGWTSYNVWHLWPI